MARPQGTVTRQGPLGYLQAPKPQSVNICNQDNLLVYHWGIRMVRRAGRDLIGTLLDETVPISAVFKGRLGKFIQRKVGHWLRSSLTYWDLFQLIKSGKPIRLEDCLKSKFISENVRIYLGNFEKGELFKGLSKVGLSAITVAQVLTETAQTYHTTQDMEKTRKVFLIESLRWLVGAEISQFGFAIGMLFAKKKEKSYLFGFFVSSLFSALGDYLVKKYLR